MKTINKSVCLRAEFVKEEFEEMPYFEQLQYSSTLNEHRKVKCCAWVCVIMFMCA